MEKIPTLPDTLPQSLLKFLQFRELDMWDVKRYATEKIQSPYPIVKLGLHIQEQSHKVKLFNFPKEEFGILGVSNKTGIFDAYTEKGANINQAYKRMERGWLAYNPYRINVGSIGIRTEEQENEFISPAYVVFSCRETLLPEFLYRLFKTERFNRIIKESTTGSVRQNLTIDILKTLEIPLPPVEVQRELLEDYFEIEHGIQKDNIEIDDTKKRIEEFIYTELNVSFNHKRLEKGISFVSAKNITRWDVAYLSSARILVSTWPIVKLEKCISNFLKGSNDEILRFESAKFPEDDFLYIGMEQVEKASGEIEELIKVKGVDIKSQTLKVPKEYIIYGKLRPYLNKFWINDKTDDNIICSSEFFVFNTKENINKSYFVSILGSSIIQKQIENNSSGARMPRINEATFVGLEIPKPSPEVQVKIAENVTRMKTELSILTANIQRKNEQALSTFQQAIFK